jgi:adenylosuccinate synthase
VRELAKAEPVFETLPGWRSSTEGISDWDALPEKAKQYLMFLEEKSRVEIGVISTGPERNQTIRRRANLLDV